MNAFLKHEARVVVFSVSFGVLAIALLIAATPLGESDSRFKDLVEMSLLDKAAFGLYVAYALAVLGTAINVLAAIIRHFRGTRKTENRSEE